MYQQLAALGSRHLSAALLAAGVQTVVIAAVWIGLEPAGQHGFSALACLALVGYLGSARAYASHKARV